MTNSEYKFETTSLFILVFHFLFPIETMEIKKFWGLFEVKKYKMKRNKKGYTFAYYVKFWKWERYDKLHDYTIKQ